ncbi:hypothetical protein [Actinomadura rubrisoli]|uniref:Uncharacterized protein n=1 Tax=Actinomadura rubrisoli TaxID=2530368 RepID=A0A4R5B7F0_9ACTN|nr:hypothetical protein [Actinomadura rubrisoli]TDD80366.1 hypothetical protein E1298_26025 [Actinomadura rubrisoli]
MSPEACARLLTCRFAELASMPMPDRLRLVRALQDGRAQSFEKGFARWNVIQAVIRIFIDNDMGSPGTWASYTNAGGLEGLLRGVALASGMSDDDYGNPSARLWARYLIDLKGGRLAVKAVHNVAWSKAEQAALDWGRDPVNNPAVPTHIESAIWVSSEAYRVILRNEPAIMIVLRALNQPKLTRCYDWLTDVTNEEAIHTAGNAIVAIARTPTNVQALSRALAQLSTFYPACTRGARAPGHRTVAAMT